MTNTTTDSNSAIPRSLDIAAKVATISLAVLAILTAFVMAIHFTIQADIGPHLSAIEISVADNKAEIKTLQATTEAQYQAVYERFNAVDQRLDNMDQRLDNMDQRLARIEKLLMSKL